MLVLRSWSDSFLWNCILWGLGGGSRKAGQNRRRLLVCILIIEVDRAGNIIIVQGRLGSVVDAWVSFAVRAET